MSSQPGNHDFDLAAAALQDLHKAGFIPEFSPEVAAQVQSLRRNIPQPGATPDLADMRDRNWSSIDNDTSRDLDQIEVAERVAGGIRIHVAIADVAAAVPQNSPIDQHAAAQTQTIYTAVRNFSMLPNELSTDLTSLVEDGDRRAVLMSFTVGANGEPQDEAVSRAWVRNRAQMAYSRVGPWLEQAAAGGAGGDLSGLRSDTAPKTVAGAFGSAPERRVAG